MATSSDFTTSNQYIVYDIVVTENSTSIPNNTSSVNVKVRAWRTNTGYTTDGAGTCYVNIDGTNYSNSWEYGEKPLTYRSFTVLFDKTVTIPHNADGSKTIYVSAYISHARFSSNSQGFNVALTTIPRQAEITSAPNFYDTDNPTIQYSNPAGNAVTSLQACITLTGAQADIPYRDVSKTGTSYTFNLTQAERNTLLAACPNSNTLEVRFYLKSVIGGQTYYSRVYKTMTVKNANPTITGASYADTNSTTTAITNNNQQIIQANSTVRFTFSSLAALKYATLTKVEITVNAVKITSNLSGSSVSNKTVDFGTINSSSNQSASIKLTDSRGNTTTQSLNITMLAWSLPTAIISLTRKSNYYDETYLNVNADYSSLNGNNTITIQYQYKERSGSTWSSLTTIQDEVTATLSLDNTKAYDFKIFVADRIGSTTYNAVLQIGIPIIYFDRLLRSVGIGTIPSQTNQLAVDRRLELKNTLQESVADLWSTVTNENYHSAFLLFKNQSGNQVLKLGGDTSNGNGYVRIYNASGNLIGIVGKSGADGGCFYIYDSNGNYRGGLYKGTNGGALELSCDSNDKRCIMAWIGTNGGNLNINDNYENPVVNAFAGSAGDGTINVYDSSQQWTINLSGQTGTITLRDGTTSNIYLRGSNGNITCVSLTQTSSRKVKDNIKAMDPEEAYKILELVAVTFDFKNKEQGTDKRGFIAEDVAEVIPELVTPETEDTNAALDYIGMIPYLQAVIKDQDKRIKALEDKIEELSKKLT